MAKFGKTMREHIEELRAEGRLEDVERTRRAYFDELERKARPSVLADETVVAELRRAGAEVTSVWDLVNTGEPYPDLVPILLAQFGRVQEVRTREGIARALATPDSRTVFAELVSLYQEEQEFEVKWALHLAIAAAADENHLSTLLDLAIDETNIGCREEFFRAAVRIDRDMALRSITGIDIDRRKEETLFDFVESARSQKHGQPEGKRS